jgi:uncharacterized Zn finger protein (UPF0148 family)
MKIVKSASVQYRKTLLGGKDEVTYDCPDCKESLKSPLTDAGNKDHCPHCECEFIVPGQEKVQEIRRKHQEQKNAEQEEANRIAENERKAKQEAYEKVLNQELRRVKSYPRSTHYIAEGLCNITNALLSFVVYLVIYTISLMYTFNTQIVAIITCINILRSLFKAVNSFSEGSKVDETSDLPNRY